MKESPNESPKILIVVLIICLCLILASVALFIGLSRLQKLLPALLNPTPGVSAGPTGTFSPLLLMPSTTIPADTQSVLEQTVVPVNDYADLTCRLLQKCGVALTLPPPVLPRQVGEQDHFSVVDQGTNALIHVTATLRYVTPHVYFWVENGASYRDADVRALVDTFESKIYPTDHAYFGSEWSPGIDGDVHIYILYTHGLGAQVAGYFSSDDEYNPLVRPSSNGHEMFLINTTQALRDPYTVGTLAHEFEHMISWNLNRDQATWLSEGSAELASFLNGYDTGGFDRVFISQPDLQLNTWPNDPSNPSADIPYYGASFLFMDYFYNRFGEQAVRTLTSEPKNGLEGVEQALRDLNIQDPLSGQDIHVNDLFLDWAITNYLNNASVGDGRYQYQNYAAAPRARPAESIPDCPLSSSGRSIHQYAAEYIRITCQGKFDLHFQGATTTPLLPVGPHSGRYAFWSNHGNSSDMILTRGFDFSGVSGPITFTYWTWYDIEKDWDYLYLEASTDGLSWQILTTPSGTPDNPTGSSFGWGYTGVSGGWELESVDLSRYAGEKVFLRFEYVTDLGVNGEGLLLDDLAIPAIHYSTGFETDDGGWTAKGFARIENVLPQAFRLALIETTAAGTEVKNIPLDDLQSADIPLSIGENGVTEAVLVVTATTLFTDSPADYSITIH